MMTFIEGSSRKRSISCHSYARVLVLDHSESGSMYALDDPVQYETNEEDKDSEEKPDDQGQIDVQQILNQIQETNLRDLQNHLTRVQELVNDPTTTPEAKAEKPKTEILQKLGKLTRPS